MKGCSALQTSICFGVTGTNFCINKMFTQSKMNLTTSLGFLIALISVISVCLIDYTASIALLSLWSFSSSRASVDIIESSKSSSFCSTASTLLFLSLRSFKALYCSTTALTQVHRRAAATDFYIIIWGRKFCFFVYFSSFEMVDFNIFSMSILARRLVNSAVLAISCLALSQSKPG